jgi:hypothetical protein
MQGKIISYFAVRDLGDWLCIRHKYTSRPMMYANIVFGKNVNSTGVQISARVCTGNIKPVKYHEEERGKYKLPRGHHTLTQ